MPSNLLTFRLHLHGHCITSSGRNRSAIRPTNREAETELAAALSGGCSVYLTSDRALPRIPGLEILQVSDYAGAP